MERRIQSTSMRQFQVARFTGPYEALFEHISASEQVRGGVSEESVPACRQVSMRAQILLHLLSCYIQRLHILQHEPGNMVSMLECYSVVEVLTSSWPTRYHFCSSTDAVSLFARPHPPSSSGASLLNQAASRFLLPTQYRNLDSECDA